MSCKVVGVVRYEKELTGQVGHEETIVGVAALGCFGVVTHLQILQSLLSLQSPQDLALLLNRLC